MEKILIKIRTVWAYDIYVLAIFNSLHQNAMWSHFTMEHVDNSNQGNEDNDMLCTASSFTSESLMEPLFPS